MTRSSCLGILILLIVSIRIFQFIFVCPDLIIFHLNGVRIIIFFHFSFHAIAFSVFVRTIVFIFNSPTLGMFWVDSVRIMFHFLPGFNVGIFGIVPVRMILSLSIHPGSGIFFSVSVIFSLLITFNVTTFLCVLAWVMLSSFTRLGFCIFSEVTLGVMFYTFLWVWIFHAMLGVNRTFYPCKGHVLIIRRVTMVAMPSFSLFSL